MIKMAERENNVESAEELDLSHLSEEDQEKVRKIVELYAQKDNALDEEEDRLWDEIDKEYESISPEADDALYDLGL